MPQLEKTLKIGLKELEDKINLGFFQSPLTYKRGRWETTVNGVKSVLIVYEQHAERVFVKPADPPEWMKDWDEDYKPSWENIFTRDYMQQQPHFSISIMLVEHGDEIRLCAMTSGSGEEQYGSSDSGGEYGLFETLDITLNILDKMYV